jgi:hypothetical protein
MWRRVIRVEDWWRLEEVEGGLRRSEDQEASGRFIHASSELLRVPHSYRARTLSDLGGSLQSLSFAD